MAAIEQVRQFKGYRTKLGAVMVTEHREVTFFISYVNCDCGCKRTYKVSLLPEEARAFAQRFYHQNETKLQKTVAAPGRFFKHLFSTLKEASKLAATKSERERF